MTNDELNIFWFLPSYGDSRYIGEERSRRPPTIQYLQTVAQTVDALGFDGALLPTGGCIDPWVVASALFPVTRRLRFLIAIRPGSMVPALAANMAASFQVASEGRLCLNIVPGDNGAAASEGIAVDKDSRYRLADVWCDALRRLLCGETVTASNDFFSLNEVRIPVVPTHNNPPLYFGGSADMALEVAAARTDVYLTWGEPPAMVAEKIERVRRLARTRGRNVRFGMRAHIVVRRTEEEAKTAAERLIDHLTSEQISRAQAKLLQSDSEGRKRMRELHDGSRENLWVGPNLWAGIGLVRGGAGTALVGSPQQIAKLMREYRVIGIDTFVLSGYPHLEEAHYVAELLFPELRRKADADTTLLPAETAY